MSNKLASISESRSSWAFYRSEPFLDRQIFICYKQDFFYNKAIWTGDYQLTSSWSFKFMVVKVYKVLDLMLEFKKMESIKSFLKFIIEKMVGMKGRKKRLRDFLQRLVHIGRPKDKRMLFIRTCLFAQGKPKASDSKFRIEQRLLFAQGSSSINKNPFGNLEVGKFFLLKFSQLFKGQGGNLCTLKLIKRKRLNLPPKNLFYQFPLDVV